MAKKNNAYCAICGNPYYVCMSCLDSMRLSPWKIHTDTAEHFKVYQIIHGFTSNVYSKDEAKVKLKNVNLSDLNTFRPHIKQIIEDILKEEKPIVRTVAKVKPIETEMKEVENNAVVENVEDIVKPIVSRKRNYKVNNEVEETE